MTHICVGKLTIIGSDNGLSPDRRQAIIWTNAGLLLIGPLGTNFSEILIEILTFSFKKMHLKVSSAKRRPFCPGLNVLTHWGQVMHLCISRLGHHWFTVLLDICLAPSHYLNQCRIIVDWIIGNIFSVKFVSKYSNLHKKKSRKCCLANGSDSVPASMCWFHLDDNGCFTSCYMHDQASFWVWAQPMRECYKVTLSLSPNIEWTLKYIEKEV